MGTGKLFISISGLFLRIATGLAVLLAFRDARAFTEVSGNVQGNTKWTRAGSPYYLNGNLLVEKGAVLTINEGVEIIARNKYHIEVGGELLLKGTAVAPIHFYGESKDYTYNILWDGIVAVSSEARISGDYTTIEHTTCAIDFNAIDMSHWLSNFNLTLQNVVFRNNLLGVRSTDAHKVYGITLNHCRFEKNETGINGMGDLELQNHPINSSDFRLINCEFENNKIAALNGGPMFKCKFNRNAKAVYYGLANVDSCIFTENGHAIQTCLVNCNHSYFYNNDTGISLQTLNLFAINNPAYAFDFTGINTNRFEGNHYAVIADSSAMPIDSFLCNVFVKNRVGVSLPVNVWYSNELATTITGHFIENTTAIEVRNDYSNSFDKFIKPVEWKFYGIYFWKNSLNFNNATFYHNFNLWKCFFCDGNTVNNVEQKLADGTNTTLPPRGLVNFSLASSLVFDTLTGSASGYFDTFVIRHSQFSPSDTVPGYNSTLSCINFNGWLTKIKQPMLVKESVILYPNPTSSVLQLKGNFSVKEIRVIDIYGAEVIKQKCSSTAGILVNISRLSTGIYRVLVMGEQANVFWVGSFSKI